MQILCLERKCFHVFQYEPEALARAYLTDKDNIIRAEDLPERFQVKLF